MPVKLSQYRRFRYPVKSKNATSVTFKPSFTATTKLSPLEKHTKINKLYNICSCFGYAQMLHDWLTVNHITTSNVIVSYMSLKVI